MEVKKIFSKRIALDLRRLGCKIVKTEPNTNHPQFDVFIFEKDEHFIKTFDEMMTKKGKTKAKSKS